MVSSDSKWNDVNSLIPVDIDILEEFMYLANSGVFQQLDILPTGNATACYINRKKLVDYNTSWKTTGVNNPRSVNCIPYT